LTGQWLKERNEVRVGKEKGRKKRKERGRRRGRK